jgi:hypothetical protein
MAFPKSFKEFILSEAYCEAFDSNKFGNKADRINSGKAIEGKIIDALRVQGWDIQPASVQQDMFDKVDAWWTLKTGTRIPLQIKYRDKSGGNDIFMEVKRDYQRNLPGRDMNSKAQIYVTLTNDQAKVILVKVDEAKKIALGMADELEAMQKINPTANRKVTHHGMIMVNPDPRTQVLKLKAYIKPDTFAWKQVVPVKLV